GFRGFVPPHVHSPYSFLEAGSSIQDLVDQAAALEMEALALTDRNRLSGAVAFTRAARAAGIRPLLGAEVTLTAGTHLTLLADGPEGYATLSQLLTHAHLSRPRGGAGRLPGGFGRAPPGLDRPLRLPPGGDRPAAPLGGPLRRAPGRPAVRQPLRAGELLHRAAEQPPSRRPGLECGPAGDRPKSGAGVGGHPERPLRHPGPLSRVRRPHLRADRHPPARRPPRAAPQRDQLPDQPPRDGRPLPRRPPDRKSTRL